MSTGCAAHSSLEQALSNALCEVIERDAAALVWLQRLSIPEIDFTAARKRGPLRSLLRHVPHLRCFNATTDVGIPVVYGVESDCADRAFTTLVTCACEPEPWRAIKKIACEAIAYRPVLRAPREIPNDPDCFNQGIQGAKYMGAPARQDAFEFLLQGTPSVGIEELPRLATDSAPTLLAQLLAQLERHNKEVFAIELTTTAALRAGLRVVRVIIPALLPLTFRMRARYLAHPRLEQGARAMGYAPRAEKDLSPWPQPIA
jgi:ribosomal protein S12 methylthiotransferase accessory factor